MEEAERCHRLAFLNRGHRVACGTPDEIRAMLDHIHVYTFTSDHDPKMDSALGRLPGVRMVNRFGLTTRLVVDSSLPYEQLVKLLGKWPGVAGKPEEDSVSLEDVFITLTGSEAA